MNRFAPRYPGDVARMIREEVLGLVTTHDAQGFITTPLPLLAELDDVGEVRALIGHFALANPHFARARATPQAQISFFGPHGYIGPGMVSKPGWAPTWHYRLAQFEVEIDLRPEASDAAIRALVEAMEGAGEGAGEGAWTIEQMGERYARLVAHVVAFRARVIRASTRFKLGQDEDEKSYGEILAALGDSALARTMR
ncbi:FMN-binding negative transcriptional regulator [Sphingomonas sp. QA11]|uniref:FMN-binding negative transcriptional regulator n=1 Tax=Sphingomonas sp. QA11 TaxID=2950605 RepID=UPI00234A3372|nr:FMN-binding negative transcriptional regulator [Sphingomonas sp. QA11]WCM25714.1 FMN-binding negative transcriptional regulator [Sphingomonas sp. QA11]